MHKRYLDCSASELLSISNKKTLLSSEPVVRTLFCFPHRHQVSALAAVRRNFVVGVRPYVALVLPSALADARWDSLVRLLRGAFLHFETGRGDAF